MLSSSMQRTIFGFSRQRNSSRIAKLWKQNRKITWHRSRVEFDRELFPCSKCGKRLPSRKARRLHERKAHCDRCSRYIDIGVKRVGVCACGQVVPEHLRAGVGPRCLGCSRRIRTVRDGEGFRCQCGMPIPPEKLQAILLKEKHSQPMNLAQVVGAA